MIRNLKTLGLALVAILALGAVAASAASAQGKLTSDGPVTLTGAETGGAGNNYLEAFGVKVECPGSTYTGHKATTVAETGGVEKNHPFIPSGATKVTLTPHYKQVNCKAAGLYPVTVDMNGCDYTVNITSAVVADSVNGTVDIVCPPGKEITVTLFTPGVNHITGTPFCTLHVKAQTGLAGAKATDTTNGTIDLTGTITGIHVLRTNTTPVPKTHTVLCPDNTTTANSTFKVDVSVAGHNEENNPTNIGLS
jgi:hypothetical protein